jgi:hypothetical protein
MTVTLTDATKKLIDRLKEWKRSLNQPVGPATIHVDEVASRVATFYEKIRKVVDWREEHLIRRIAIERMLKRRLFITKTEEVTESFVLELIRGGHFPNDTIDKSKIGIIRVILQKYTYILKNSPLAPKHRNRGELLSYIAGIAACEIEETLDPPIYLRANAMLEYMETIMLKRFIIGKKAQQVTNVTEEEKNIQIYIAVQQALLRLDPAMITYNLLKRKYQNWCQLPPETLPGIAAGIYGLWDEMDGYFNHPLADKFYKICLQYDTAYLIIGDIMAADPDQAETVMSDPKILDPLLKKDYQGRRTKLKSKIGRAAFYSTLSIFITNIFSLYVLEIPFTIYVMGKLNMLAQVIDVVGPTFLMFIIVVSIRPPGPKNQKLVLDEVYKNIYNETRKDVYEIELYPKRSFAFRAVIGLLYVISFCLSVGLLLWGLYELNFPPLSYFLLTMFTSLIAFTGTIIRKRARELHVTPERDTLFDILLDPLSLPFIAIGKWFMARWKKLNIVAVVFSFLIDTPFMLFAELLEHWRYFVKERKENIR